MCASVGERMSLKACEGGARGVEGATPARAQSPESAGERIGLVDLMEVERLVYGFVKKVGLRPEDYARIEQELRDHKITVYGRSYKLSNSTDEIQKILGLSWDAPIKVKASSINGKIRLDVFEVGEFLEERVVEEKKLQGLSRAVVHKLVRVQRKQLIKNIFTGETWIDDISVASFEDRFEDFVTGKALSEEEALDYLDVKVVKCVDVPNPHFKTHGLQRIYIFSDGTVVEFWGYKITGGGREDLSALESLDAGGEGGEEPIFVFRNRDVSDRIWRKIYLKAIELYHRREAEEWRRQREQWRREIEESQKTDDIANFLRSKKGGITKQELDWLKNVSPATRDMYVYFDPNEGIEVLWLGGEVAVNIKGEKFKIPIKEVA